MSKDDINAKVDDIINDFLLKISNVEDVQNNKTYIEQYFNEIKKQCEEQGKTFDIAKEEIALAERLSKIVLAKTFFQVSGLESSFQDLEKNINNSSCQEKLIIYVATEQSFKQVYEDAKKNDPYLAYFAEKILENWKKEQNPIILQTIDLYKDLQKAELLSPSEYKKHMEEQKSKYEEFLEACLKKDNMNQISNFIVMRKADLRRTNNKRQEYEDKFFNDIALHFSNVKTNINNSTLQNTDLDSYFFTYAKKEEDFKKYFEAENKTNNHYLKSLEEKFENWKKEQNQVIFQAIDLYKDLQKAELLSPSEYKKHMEEQKPKYEEFFTECDKDPKNANFKKYIHEKQETLDADMATIETFIQKIEETLNTFNNMLIPKNEKAWEIVTGATKNNIPYFTSSVQDLKKAIENKNGESVFNYTLKVETAASNLERCCNVIEQDVSNTNSFIAKIKLLTSFIIQACSDILHKGHVKSETKEAWRGWKNLPEETKKSLEQIKESIKSMAVDPDEPNLQKGQSQQTKKGNNRELL